MLSDIKLSFLYIHKPDTEEIISMGDNMSNSEYEMKCYMNSIAFSQVSQLFNPLNFTAFIAPKLGK